MSVASRSIMEGLQIGESLGKPFNRYFMQKNEIDADKAARQMAFDQKIKELQLTNPDLASAMTQLQAGQTVDGQQSVKPLAMTPDQQAAAANGNKIPEVPTQEVGGFAYDPVAYKKAITQNELDKSARELGFHKQLADYQNQISLKKPMEVSPGATIGTYDDIMGGKGFKVPEKGTEPKPFTLSPGEKLFSPNGQVLADNPKDSTEQRPITVSPGAVVIGSDGKEIFRNPAASSQNIKMSTSDEKFVDTLSTKNANKVSIANQLQEGFNLLSDPKISDSEKVKEGQRLLKVLNSSEGQDAVGKEESERLGSMLEYNFGGIGGIKASISGTGAFIGRDIPGFTSQLKNAVGSIRQSAESNQKEIDKVQSRYGIAPAPKESSSGPAVGSIVKQNGKVYKFDGKNYNEIK